MVGVSAKDARVEPLRRLRGRPRKLSPATILQAAQELLADISPDQLTLGRVAERLGAPVTSVSNYFPNRFALVAALAESLFPRFAFSVPGPETPWPQAVMAWLRAVEGFFQAHPVAMKVIGVDDRTSPAWAHVQAPLIELLQRRGLAGRELAATVLAVHSQLIGLLYMATFALRPQPDDAASLPLQASAEQRSLAEVRAWRAAVRREEIVGFGLRAIVAELERTAGVHGVPGAGAGDF